MGLGGKLRRGYQRLVAFSKPYRSVPVEALLIVFFSQLPVLLAAFFARATLDEDKLRNSSFWMEVIGRYSANDVFIYATGVLGSAVVFFVLRLRSIGNRGRVVVTGILFPLLIIFGTALIPASSILTDGEPNAFVRDFSVWMLVFLLVAWLTALVEQRNITDRELDIEGKAQRSNMAEGAKGKVG